jgi:putative membrane protein
MTRTNVIALGAAAFAALLAGVANAQDGGDAKFLEDAIQTDIAEVKLSELALQRSNDDHVRELAHRLQTDHSASMQQSIAVAKNLGLKMPSTPTADALEHYAALEKLSGEAFDAAFVRHMVDGHREAVAKFEQQSHSNSNSAIADLVAETLPQLKEHLSMAESLLAAGHAAAGAHGAQHGTAQDPQLRIPAPEPSTPR